jgi:osmotically-inducible protein OsmY
MSTATLTTKDVRVRDAVMRQLEWDPQVDASAVGVAARALELRSTIPQGVQAIVHNGHVTLTGHVNWLFQKQGAEKAVRHIRGVHSVLNHITVATQPAVRDVKRSIVKALHQNADVDARHISVTVSGGEVTLTGTVGSWLQRDAAERAAEDAPGVAQVDNRLVVEPAFDYETEPIDDEC